MVFATVDTKSRVGARLPIRCRMHQRCRIRTALATGGKRPMVFDAVRASTVSANHARSSAEVLVVTPETTARTEGNANLRRSLPEKTNRGADIDRTPNESLHPRSRLRIPDVEEDRARIRAPGIANDPGGSSKTNTVREDRGVEDAFSIPSDDGDIDALKKGDAHKFTK
jgi:hypothetical protein